MVANVSVRLWRVDEPCFLARQLTLSQISEGIQGWGHGIDGERA